MPTRIKTGWLYDKDGKKFAPKTLMSQIQTDEGEKLEDKLRTDFDKITEELKDRAEKEHEHEVMDITGLDEAYVGQGEFDGHVADDTHLGDGERTKWNEAYTHISSAHVTGVKGSAEDEFRSGAVEITAANIGLGNVDNTKDKDKPVSQAQQAAMDQIVNNAENYTKNAIVGLASEDFVTKKIKEHDSAKETHSDIRELIKTLTDQLNALANSSEEDLDCLAEIVDYIKSNRTLIDEITIKKINVADIVNDLITNDSSKVLAASQGVKIQALIDALQEELDSLDVQKMDKGNPVGTGSFSLNRKNNTTTGYNSVAVGYNATASALASIAEGYCTVAHGRYSHSEGYATKALGEASHAEAQAVAAGNFAHAEGLTPSPSFSGLSGDAGATTYTVPKSFANYFIVGTGVQYNNNYAKIVSVDNTDSSITHITLDKTLDAQSALNNADITVYAHSAIGNYSHTEGYGTSAFAEASHAQGKHNIRDVEQKYAHIVGNGTGVYNASNAHTLDWDGNAWFSGDVYVGSTSGKDKDDGSKKLATENYVDAGLEPIASTTNNSIKELTVSGKTITYIKNDDTTGTITTQDTVYELPSAGDVLGGVKSGGDVKISDGIITVEGGTADSLKTEDTGSETQPVYFVDGKPVVTQYSLGKSVPENAVFTDTTYDAATVSDDGLMSASDKNKLNSTNIAYGVCSTAAETAAKIITLESNDQWALTNGSLIMVLFVNSNTASNVTLNVNGTGAYPIWYNNAEYTNTGTAYTGYANRVTTYMFNGTHWVWIASSYDSNTTYTNVKLGHGYATCSTAAATTAKVVALSNYTLTTGGIVAVKFTYAVPANATLNINSKGAKPIYYRGAAITAGIINAGDTSTFIYSNAKYHLISIDNISVIQNQIDDKVPTSRTVNGKKLSADITLSAADVNADPSGSAASVLSAANTYTDEQVATKAPKTLVVSSNYDDNSNLVSNYSSDEILAHIANGGDTIYADMDLGKFAYLWAYARKVYYGGTVMWGDTLALIAYEISGNEINQKFVSYSDFALSSNVCTKKEFDDAVTLITSTYETQDDASGKLTEAKAYTDDLGSAFIQVIMAMYGDDIDENDEQPPTIRTIAKNEIEIHNSSGTAHSDIRKYVDDQIATAIGNVEAVLLEADALLGGD